MPAHSLDEDRERLRSFVEAARGFSGWSFPVLERKLEPRAWDYDQRAADLIKKSAAVLDIGTGGGERLSRYCRDFSGYAAARKPGRPTFR